jgi:hypothetical protein
LVGCELPVDHIHSYGGEFTRTRGVPLKLMHVIKRFISKVILQDVDIKKKYFWDEKLWI